MNVEELKSLRKGDLVVAQPSSTTQWRHVESYGLGYGEIGFVCSHEFGWVEIYWSRAQKKVFHAIPLPEQTNWTIKWISKLDASFTRDE